MGWDGAGDFVPVNVGGVGGEWRLAQAKDWRAERE